MTAADFLDTNVLVYAYDADDPRKQRTAQDILRRALIGEMVISIQVLAEFAVTFLHKTSHKLKPDEVMDLLHSLEPIKSIVPDAGIIQRAVEAHVTYDVHFYDGMIIAAAERAGCQRILSEDMNAGQQYFGITVVNPFISN